MRLAESAAIRFAHLQHAPRNRRYAKGQHHVNNTILAAMVATALVLAGCAGSQTSSDASISPSPSSTVQTAQSSTEASSNAPTNSSSFTAPVSTIAMKANGVSLQMTLADTEAALALAELLGNGPISVSLRPYGGFEKVGSLPQALPTSDRQVATAPGDVMLYQGNQISIFYDTNTWEYTPLGHIEGATAQSLLDALGEGDVAMELSL